MADIKFRKVSDSLIEVLCDGVINIFCKEDAVQLGYTEFTYKGKPISYASFARIIGKASNTVQSIVNKHNLTTGEKVIEFYKKYDENKSLTYQGKPITYTEFAKIIGKSVSAVQHTAQIYDFTTGEQIIEHYRKLKSFTYQGKPITLAAFAMLINKADSTVKSTAYRYGYTTGEQIIEHYKNFGQVKLLTYQGKSITYTEFAKLIDKSYSAINNIIHKYGYTTGEELIEYYRKRDSFTYKGKPITYAKFAKLINKKYVTIYTIVNRCCYTTGEEVIEYYRMKGKL